MLTDTSTISDATTTAGRNGDAINTKPVVPLAAVPIPVGRPVVLVPHESRLESVAYSVLAAALLIGFYFAMLQYWSPAHPGVDQNGYLVGGKMFAKTLTTKTTVPDIYAFVGRMWIGVDLGTSAERYYPKYPLGLPVLYAIALWIGGSHGIELAFKISPVCMLLAIAGTYRLLRLFLPSFYSLLGMILVAVSPVTLGLTNNPNSHASCLAAVVWGMYLLLSWWQMQQSPELGPGRIWRPILAGFLLGYAVTIRYSEGLLILPMLAAVLMSLKFSRRYLIECGAMLVAWAIPIAALVAFNYFAFGHVTGYDPTRESMGFTWKDFSEHWEIMLRQLNATGLFFIFPFAVIGLVVMFASNWRLAGLVALWIVPCIIAYTAYYWTSEGWTGYLRFFLTIVPPLALCAAWAFRSLATHDHPRTATIGVGVIVAICVGMNLYTSTPNLEGDARTNLAIDLLGQRTLQKVPADAVLYTLNDNQANYLQFVGDWQIYTMDMFSQESIRRIVNRADTEDPTPFQPQRARRVYEVLGNLDNDDLVDEQNRLMKDALDSGKRVFVVGPQSQLDQTRRRFFADGKFKIVKVDTWAEPPDNRAPRDRRNPNRPTRRGGGGAPFAPGGPPAGGAFVSSVPGARWNLVEIKLAPPPATKPSTRPATAPAKPATTRPTTQPR